MPTEHEIMGEWSVRVRWLPFWKDKKVVTGIGPGHIHGYNINGSGKNGYFDVHKFEVGDYAILDYRNEKNGWFWGHMVDHVRIYEGVVHGKIYRRICGLRIKVGSFTMERMKS